MPPRRRVVRKWAIALGAAAKALACHLGLHEDDPDTIRWIDPIDYTALCKHCKTKSRRTRGGI